MSEKSKAAQCGTNPTSEGGANARADKVLKARRPSAAQGGSAHGLSKAAAATPAASVHGDAVGPSKPSAAAAASPPLFAPQHCLTTAAAAPSQGVPDTAVHPSLFVSFFDRYFGRHMRVPVNELSQVLLPCRLVHVVLRFRAQRLGQPLPDAPDYGQLEITPLQLQRFPGGCALSLTHALVAPPACVFRLVPARTKGRWVDRIFIRVMSGFVARAEQTLLDIKTAAAARVAGKPGIHDAVKTGDIELLRDRLTAYPAEVNAKDRGSQTPLHWYSFSARGHVSVCRVLVELKADVDAKNNSSQTPLHWSSSQGHVAACRVLVELKADVNAKDSDSTTPLHRSSEGDHVAACRFLVESKADVNAKNRFSQTPLHLSSSQGHVAACRVLVELKADVNAKDNGSTTPLHRSSYYGHVALCSFLVESKADVTARDRYGKTPLIDAMNQGKSDVVACLQGLSI